MIDFETKTIYLGCGDVCVGNNRIGLTLQNIRPPQPCGSVLHRDDPELEFLGSQVCLEITSLEEVSSFSKQLKSVRNSESDKIVWKDWTIQFIPNSHKSVDVVDTHFYWVKQQVLFCCAC